MFDEMVLWWIAWMRPTIPFLVLGIAIILFVEGLVAMRVSTPRPYTQPIRMGWSADDRVDVADFTVQNDRSSLVEIPDPGEGGYYLVLWRADVDGGAFSFIDPADQSLNQRVAFTDAWPLTIDGVAGQAVRSVHRWTRRVGRVRVDEPPGWITQRK